MLNGIDRCADIQKDRDRCVSQVMEADIRQAILAQDLLELPGDLGLIDVGTDPSREDHAILFPAISNQGLLGLLPLMVRSQHCQAILTQLDLATTGHSSSMAKGLTR